MGYRYTVHYEASRISKVCVPCRIPEPGAVSLRNSRAQKKLMSQILGIMWPILGKVSLIWWAQMKSCRLNCWMIILFKSNKNYIGNTQNQAHNPNCSTKLRVFYSNPSHHCSNISHFRRDLKIIKFTKIIAFLKKS